jgi:hypothetical protein
VTGLPWTETFRDFAQLYRYTPRDVLEGMTFGQFFAVWCDGGNSRAEHDPDRLRNQINRRRAAKNLPPMKPAPKKG